MSFLCMQTRFYTQPAHLVALYSRAHCNHYDGVNTVSILELYVDRVKSSGAVCMSPSAGERMAATTFLTSTFSLKWP